MPQRPVVTGRKAVPLVMLLAVLTAAGLITTRQAPLALGTLRAINGGVRTETPIAAGRVAPSAVDPEFFRAPTGTVNAGPSQYAKALPAAELVSEMLAQISRDRILADLRRLTGEEPICTTNGCYTISDRDTASEGLRWAKDYIRADLIRSGYSVEVENWSRTGLGDQNLIVRKTGSVLPGEEVYFVAHIDGVKLKAAQKAPAADDNASGVADLLEVARILRDQPLSRTVVLFFSTGEEHSARGVRSYIDHLSPQEFAAIKYVVDVDMVGYDLDHDGAMQLWPGDHAPSLALAQILSDAITQYRLNLTPEIITGCA